MSDNKLEVEPFVNTQVMDAVLPQPELKEADKDNTESKEKQLERVPKLDQNGCGCNDPSKYYRNLPHWKMFLEDPVMMGSNYYEYTDYVRPKDVEIKITPYKNKGFQPQGEVLPVASNYAFHTSVSMDKQIR